jgi:hypothetical protein
MRPSWNALNILLLSICNTIQPTTASQIPLFPASHSQDYKFDPLLHLPGISPYFDAIGFGLDHKAPLDCEVTAASYLVRHAAIYANDQDYEDYIGPLLKKIDSTYPDSDVRGYVEQLSTAFSLSGRKRRGWTGSLAFFDKWKTPILHTQNGSWRKSPRKASRMRRK